MVVEAGTLGEGLAAVQTFVGPVTGVHSEIR